MQRRNVSSLLLGVVLVALVVAMPLALAYPTTDASSASLDRAVAQPAMAQPGQQLCLAGPSIQAPWRRSMLFGASHLVYNPQANEFVALGIRYGTAQYLDPSLHQVAGLRLRPDGQPLAAAIDLGLSDQQAGPPTIAYSPASQQYLVAAEITNEANGEPYVIARLYDTSLQPLGGPGHLPLSVYKPRSPVVTYNPDDDEFLLVWQDERAAPSATVTQSPPGPPTLTPTPSAIPSPAPEVNIPGLYVQRIRPGGPTHTSRSWLVLEQTVQDPGLARIVYNPQTQQYLLVALRDGRLVAQTLNRPAEPVGAPVTLVGAPGLVARLFLAYNAIQNQYLLVWSTVQDPATLGDVYALILKADLSPVGPAIAIQATTDHEIPTGLVYNPQLDEYALSVERAGPEGARSSITRLSSSGAVLGLAVDSEGGVAGLGVTQTGEYLALDRYGHGTQAWRVAEVCDPGLTPDPSATATPLSGRLEPPLHHEWVRVIEVMPPTRPRGDRANWLVERRTASGPVWLTLSIPRPAWLDQRMTHAERNGQAWIWAREYDGRLVADLAVVLPHVVNTPTPQPSPTPTATPQHPSCWVGPTSALTWPAGTAGDTLQVAYNDQAEEFVVIAARHVGGGEQPVEHSIEAFRLSTSGEVRAGPRRLVSELLQTRPVLGYSPVANHYLVVWGRELRENGIATTRLMGQMFTADLAPHGQPFELGSTLADHLALSYNRDDDEFLVVWREMPRFHSPAVNPSPPLTPTPAAPGDGVIKAQRVRSDGTLVGTATVVTTHASVYGQLSTPQVAYNSIEHEYRLVWGRDGRLETRRLSRQGDPVGEVGVLPDTRLAYANHIVFDPSTNRYLVVWSQYREQRGTRVEGVILAADGAPQLSLPLSEPPELDEVQAVAVQPTTGEYLIATRHALLRFSPEPQLRDRVVVEPWAVGLGVAAPHPTTLVFEGYGYTVRRLATGAACQTPPPFGTATPTAIPVARPQIVEWEGIIGSIQPGQGGAVWVVGEQTVEVTALTRINAPEGAVAVGGRARVVAQQLTAKTRITERRIALSIVVEPPIRQLRLYLPSLLKETGP